jgi:hypothetical protein
MQELEITLDRVSKIWWLQFWRVAAVGAVFSAVTFLAEMHVPATANYIQIGTTIALLGWQFKVTKMALQKRYEDFRIVLVPLDPTGPAAREVQ